MYVYRIVYDTERSMALAALMDENKEIVSLYVYTYIHTCMYTNLSCLLTYVYIHIIFIATRSPFRIIISA